MMKESMKRLITVACIILLVLIPTAASGEAGGEASGQDSFVPPAGKFSSQR